mgnify:FL=1
MEEKFYNVDSIVDWMCKNGYFPGATYSISDGKSYCEGFKGYRSLIPTKVENNIDTLYDMASLTKVIVTNTILTKALQEGRINLSDKLEKFLPQYSDLDINIYSLVTHTSGLSADFDIPNIHSNEDFLKQLNDMNKEYETGTDVVYSDIGFVLLGKVLEKVYGKSLDVIAIEKIFKPLDMKTATFHPKKENTAPTEYTKERGLVWGKTHDEKAYYSKDIIGHAGLFCSVEDVRKFTDMILNDGIVNDSVYLEKKYLDLWFTPCVTEYDGTVRSIGWIYGKSKNVTGDSVSDNTIYHTGFTGTSIVVDRDNKLSIILLSNRVHPTRENRKLIPNRHLLVDAVLNKKNNLENGKSL